MQEAIIRMKQLLALTGVSRSTAYCKWNKTGPYFDPLFPQPLKLGGLRSIGFRMSDLKNWQDSLSKAA